MESQKTKFWEKKPVFFITTFIWTGIILILGSTVSGIITLSSKSLTDDLALTAIEYINFIGIWIVAFLSVGLFKSNRPILKAFGTKAKGNNLWGMLIGLVIGGGMNLICAFSAMGNKDISVRFNRFDIISVIILFICVMIQSGAEELVMRFFVYQRLRKIFKNPWIPIVINAMIFAVAHIPNDGATVLSTTNVLLVGILYSVMVFYFDSLWMAIMAHTAWNFTQSIALGLPNSGVVVPYSIFKLDTAAATDSFVYNVGFGLEGTVLCTVLHVIVIVALVLIGKKRNVPALNVWEEINEE